MRKLVDRLDPSGARWIVALALAILVGNITDRTTGQPLTGVDVTVQSSSAQHARSNDAGTYTLGNLHPGRYTLTLRSDDVPPQTFEVVIGTAKTQRLNIIACSTTLDYSCASTQP